MTHPTRNGRLREVNSHAQRSGVPADLRSEQKELLAYTVSYSSVLHYGSSDSSSYHHNEFNQPYRNNSAYKTEISSKFADIHASFSSSNLVQTVIGSHFVFISCRNFPHTTRVWITQN
jgi:hypothetical protein